MENLCAIIILTSIFIILLVVSSKTLQSVLGFSEMHCIILAVCTIIYSAIGIVHCWTGSPERILLPYALLAMAFLLLVLFLFLYRSVKYLKNRLSNRASTKNVPEMNDERLER